jgi:ribonuclease E
MAKKMLIDATHPEETRVVVADGNRVDDFDFESASRRQLAGNIYLAKVTRVEPSLQAAFIDYGGNRHGFLAFAEIHPDYYQIPVADRQALLAEERALAESQQDEEDAGEDAEAAASEDEGGDRRRGRSRRGRGRALSRDGDAVATREAGAEPNGMETIDLAEGEEASPATPSTSTA